MGITGISGGTVSHVSETVEYRTHRNVRVAFLGCNVLRGMGFFSPFTQGYPIRKRQQVPGIHYCSIIILLFTFFQSIPQSKNR